MDIKKLSIGYLPINQNFDAPGDRRRFVYYAKSRNLNFEIADPTKKYDIVILTQNADLSIWCKYDLGGAKIIYDFIDSYLAIPENDLKSMLRGIIQFFSGKNKFLRLNHRKSIELMCLRSNAVICSTDEQESAIKPLCKNVHQVLDIHTTVHKKTKVDYVAGETFNIVWEGLGDNIYQVNLLKDVLNKLEKKHKIALHFVTDLYFHQYARRYFKTHTKDVVKNLCKNVYVYDWNEKFCSDIITSCDLAIIPVDLKDPRAKGKPENKLLLFWRMGMPVITTATPAYIRAMQKANLDMYCKTKDDWFRKIDFYITNKKARISAGMTGKKIANEFYDHNKTLDLWDNVIKSISKNKNKNYDKETIEGFGDEWHRFDQSNLSPKEHQDAFQLYFSIFPWKKINRNSIGFDLGCGSGRWAILVAPKVKKLHCIEPSAAIEVAKSNLSKFKNCEFHKFTVDEMPLDNNSMDFGYSLGVLHHIPDTQAGLNECVKKLKIGAPFLLYLYYDIVDKPWWYRFLWQITDYMRKFISRLPHAIRYWVCQILALLIYLPLAKISKFTERMGLNYQNIPLYHYRNLSFYLMRTDALDRFGTKLELRFSREEIEEMMNESGLENIKFSNFMPYWCAVGYKKNL